MLSKFTFCNYRSCVCDIINIVCKYNSTRYHFTKYIKLFCIFKWSIYMLKGSEGWQRINIISFKISFESYFMLWSISEISISEYPLSINSFIFFLYKLCFTTCTHWTYLREMIFCVNEHIQWRHGNKAKPRLSVF